jgi:L-fuculose-phosphate aldolase
MTHDQAVAKLILAGRILVHQGQGDMTRGHVSLRLPGQDQLFLMKPNGIGMEEMTPQNVLTVGLDGVALRGQARQHSEVFIHSEIFRARPDVQCVVHTHPVHFIALSATGKPLRPHCQGGAIFTDRLPVFDATMQLIRDPAMGAAVARALGPHMAVSMKSHGLVMACASVEEAIVFTVMIEEACRIQLLIEAAGGAAPEFPPEDVALLREAQSAPAMILANFAYLGRLATGGTLPPSLATLPD